MLALFGLTVVPRFAGYACPIRRVAYTSLQFPGRPTAKTSSRARPHVCKPMEICFGSEAAIGTFWICTCQANEKTRSPLTFGDNMSACAALYTPNFHPFRATGLGAVLHVQLRNSDRVLFGFAPGSEEKPTPPNTLVETVCSGSTSGRPIFPNASRKQQKYLAFAYRIGGKTRGPYAW